MADSKITALTSIGASTDPANDPLVLVDVSDTSMAASGTTKKVTLNQLLGASGTATLASATITGDLTVDTSTLKVDSANNRVGIVKTTPAYPLDVGGRISYSTGIGEGTDLTVSSSGTSLQIGLGSSWTQQLFYLAGSEAMRLNSTGLGVGVSPSYKLHVVQNSSNRTGWFEGSNTLGTSLMLKNTSAGGGEWSLLSFGSGNAEGAGNFGIANLGGNRFTIDSSGNVGVGVTPSAWSWKALQVGAFGGFLATNSAAYASYLGNNCYYDGTAWKYIASSGAVHYEIAGGDRSHKWYNAATGTAGNAITFTQAMTLDASGNLLVGKTATGVGTVGNEIKAVGEFYSTQSASTNANFTYHVYSTGAAAYRFYVGLGGTVYATNTTISAISDARLKENVQDIDVGLDAILALKPRKFDWKNGKGKNIKGDRGFIAQEFETVFPNLVDEWKDPAPEGEAPYKSVRQDLIPVLVKAVQELAAEVNALKNA
jgi:hypothetical protein